MNRLLALGALLVLGTSLRAEPIAEPIVAPPAEPLSTYCPSSSCCNGDGGFFFLADALFLHLDRPADQPLVLNENSLGTLLSVRDLDFDWEVGPRIAAGYRFNQNSALELSYFGLHNWSASSQVSGDNDLRIPGDLALASDDFRRQKAD